MSLFVEIITLLFQCTTEWVRASYRAIVPARWLGFKDVSGQLVLVTGAGSGMGRLMALRFAERGSNLVLWDVNEKGNEETAKLVKEKGVSVAAYTVDLSKRDKIYETADKVKSEVGDVDILINNAGVVTGKKLMDCPDHLIQLCMDVNINAHFWTVKSFLPAMLKKNKGHIVTVASCAGLFGVKGAMDYCASKFAAVGFDESLRNELWGTGKRGVKTTVICPFFINTGMFDGVTTRFPRLLPILEPDYAVKKIMEAILTDQLMLMTPRTMGPSVTLGRLIPYEVGYLLGDFLGTNWAMDRFVGRKKEA